MQITGKGGQLIKPGTPRRVAYGHQDHLKEGLEQLQKQQILVPLGMDETSVLCSSFGLVLKAKVLIRLLYRDCT